MTARRLVIMHSKLIREAARLEASAKRTDDSDRRLQLLDDAAEARADAEALADMLRRDDTVYVPDPRQLLLGVGGVFNAA